MQTEVCKLLEKVCKLEEYVKSVLMEGIDYFRILKTFLIFFHE